MTESK